MTTVLDGLRGKKILVTGAGGFLGRHVAARLHAAGSVVTATDIPLSRLDRLANLSGVHIRLCDFTRKAEVARLVMDEKPDVVAHLASVLNCPDEDLNYRVNFEGTRNLAEAMHAAGIRRLIFVSSMTATFPKLNAYGRSKKLAEEHLKEKFFELTIVRPNLMYGVGGLAFEKLIGFVKMLPFIVPVIGDGNVLKQPIHVEDMAELLARVIAGPTAGELFQVGGPDRLSFNDYLDEVCAVLNLKKIKVHVPYGLCMLGANVLAVVLKTPPVTPDNVYELNQPVNVECAALEQRFGFKMRTLTEGLRQALHA